MICCLYSASVNISTGNPGEQKGWWYCKMERKEAVLIKWTLHTIHSKMEQPKILLSMIHLASVQPEDHHVFEEGQYKQIKYVSKVSH